MGQRANLVIVQQHNWHLYYDHWCANRLDIELFWGPRLARKFIEQRKPLPNHQDWLDEVWCEGAVVLDEDRKILLWYGGEDIKYDIPLRRAFLNLMKNQWPDWSIRWATGGIVEIGAYVGIPEELFLVKSTSQSGFMILTEFPDDNDTLVTIQQQGRCLAGQIYGSEEALGLGPSQLPILQEAAREPMLVWFGEMPVGGLHVEVETRTLHYWRALPAEALEERVQRGWSGWKTVWLKDDFEEHLRLASMVIQLPHRDFTDLQRQVLGSLRARCTHEAVNPVREIAARYESAEINPLTDVNRSSVGSEIEKLRLLEALECKIQAP
ncbi:MAG: hypothetical protein K1Y36_09940 [Blastocatellia bacterium]|nr:hypothetical protein [Blastocatellia bacterium]